MVVFVSYPRINNPRWIKVSPQAAGTRVAVLPEASAMIVNSNGDVWRLNRDGAGDVLKGVVAREIGVARDGTVWVVSNQKAAGGNEIYRLDWKSKTWKQLPGAAAVRIAVL